MTKKKRKVGRPSSYDPEVAAEICHRIAEGELLIHICKDDHLPCRSTVTYWTHQVPEFSAMYTRARESQAWGWVEETLCIADENEYDTAIDDDGKVITNHEHINRARLKVDTRKWAATKIAARVFGELVKQEISGPEGEPLSLAVDRPPRETREEWEARVQSKLNQDE